VLKEADERGKAVMEQVNALLARTLGLIAPALSQTVQLKVLPLFKANDTGKMEMVHEVIAVPRPEASTSAMPFRLSGLGTLPNEFSTTDVDGKPVERFLSRAPQSIRPEELRPLLAASVTELQRRMTADEAARKQVEKQQPRKPRGKKPFKVFAMTVLHPKVMLGAMVKRAVKGRRGRAA
jgi:hypothetical protein